MKKKNWIWVGAVAAVLVIAAGIWLASSPKVSAAILYVDSGTVEVDVGKGWVAGTDEMELSQGAKVRTKDGTASVILQEGEVMHLEPNTEVSLSQISGDKMHMDQASGETWNKITRISGITTYEVETPTTVATVRGTEFFVNIGAEDDIAVEEGNVEVGFTETPTKKLVVGKNRRLRAKLGNMTEEVLGTDPRAEKFRQKYIKALERLRTREMKKHQNLIGIAKRTQGMTDEQIQQYISDLDEGRQDLESAYSQVPGVFKSKVQRSYLITKAIRKAKGLPSP
jgi:hypothetical protein